MTQFLVGLANLLPYLLALTGLAVLVAVLLVVRHLRKGRRAAIGRTAAAAGADGEPVVELLELPPLPRPRQIRRTVGVGFAALRDRVTNRALRYRTPVFLVLGPEGSGKSTMLGELLPEAVAPRDPTEALGCRWHFFDRGVAIEVDGRLFNYDADPHASEQGWNALNHALRRHRPERPIDGIILTLPAGDLTGPRRLDDDALVGRARAAFSRLQAAQKVLGVRVPLYVVVTKCDLVRGFQDLCTTLPDERRQESFGWANPYALESAFVPEWIDEGFQVISDDLFEVQMELLARGSAERPEGLFEFSGAFRALQGPLRTFTSELCRESAYQESFFFRGVYFTGDGTPDPGERLLDAEYIDAGDVEVTVSAEAVLPGLPATIATSRQPYFLGDLFGTKIFGETGLARPAYRSKLSRNRTVLAMQVAMLVIAILGGIGLWRASISLEREAGLLEAVLRDINNDLTFLEETAATSNGLSSDSWSSRLNNRVFPLLSSMARVNENRLSSVFIPSSWASRLHWDISESMRQGFTRVILPALHSAMLAKADSIVGAGTPATTGQAMLDGGELPRYLAAVAQLGQNLERYDTVAYLGAEDTELQNMAELVLYLFNEQLPPEFLGNERYHRIALWESYGTRITERDRPNYSRRVVERGELLLRDYYDALISRLEDINSRFRSAEAAGRLTAVDLADFRRLRDELLEVERVLTGSEAYWFDVSRPLAPELLGVIDSIPRTPLTDPTLIRAEFSRVFDQVRQQKVQELNFRLSPFRDDAAYVTSISGDGGGTMGLSPQLANLKAALDTLFSQPFISRGPVEASRPPPPLGSRIRWDVGGLDRALVEYSQFQEFMASRQAVDAPGPRRLLEGLATVQLERRLGNAVRNAMLAEPPNYAFGLRDRERELRARIAAFQEPSSRLIQIIDIADQSSLIDLYDELGAIYFGEAMSMLAEVDALLEEGGLYRPVGSSLTAWNGAEPAYAAAFRTRSTDELERYLEQQRTRARFLVTNFAAPLLAGLTADPLARYLEAEQGGARALIDKWTALVTELDRYDAGAGTTSVDLLEQFIRVEMATTDVLDCVANADGTGGSTRDFFLAARERLRTQLYGRCQQLAFERARTIYSEIQRFFNANLAGRYPFSSDFSPGSPEADVSTIRAFYAVFDQLGDYRAAVLGGAQTDFLRRMADARAFLAPLLDPEAAPLAPVFQVGAAFRVNREEELGGDQIVDWTLDIGGTTLTPRATEGAAAEWRLGAPASLSLRWALQSDFRPRSIDGLEVVDREAIFRYGGRWGLLRLLEQHVLDGGGGAGGFLLQFEVPTVRAVGTSAVPAEQDARVYLQLRLRHPDGTPAPALPLFPVQAPA